MKPLRVLVACEYSRTVAGAFEALGHYALSCDLLPADVPGNHYQGDVRDVIQDDFDLMVAHPPCTYLCSSGLHWNKRVPGRAAQTEDALAFVALLLAAPIPHIALENPIGCIGTRIRPASQIVQPYQFGDDASKATCLWLQNLPLLTATSMVAPRVVGGKNRWANQTDSGQNKLPPSADRWKLRSATYPGIAAAIATQWSEYINTQRSSK